ncbi:MAG: LysR substrate-binding domain-containing protein [Candidatus Competibacterales bacterium]
MFQRLPSPAALRTFEAAARLGSFKAAAAELWVTPTAVSHQIRALEDHLGVALFVRRTRAVELTEAGRRLAPAVHSALLAIHGAVEEIHALERVLTVTTTPAFAALRLVPHLPDFQRRHPDTRVQQDTGTATVDLRRDRRVDLAIRYGFGPFDGLHAVPLVGEWFGAFAAPEYLAKRDDPTRGTLLETRWQQPLLGEITWSTWLATAGVPRAAELDIMGFDEEHFVLQAAIAGQGMVLASSVVVKDLVARRLLAPYRPEIRLAGARYTALCLPERLASTKVQRFLSWLEETVAR